MRHFSFVFCKEILILIWASRIEKVIFVLD